MFRYMATVNEIADQYVTDVAALDPLLATSTGVTGYDHLMPDLSPDGLAAMADLSRVTITSLAAAEPTGRGEQIAKQAMVERLGIDVELYDSGETSSELNVITSWLQSIRQVFDLMPTQGEEAVANLTARLAQVPGCYTGLRQTYLESARQGHIAARRQVSACARQCAEWSAPDTGFFLGLAGRVQAAGTLRTELDAAAAAASAATAEMGRFLETELLPLARVPDAAGRERFALHSRHFLGAVIDPDEAYAWGWGEVNRIEHEMQQVSDKIVSGGSVAEAVAALDADPERQITGREALREWMQGVADQTIAELNGTHFDIPEPARRIEAMISPTGDGGIYYTGPNEDWSRPGRMWWAVPDSVNEFATWKELTTIYHEGVPGHHLQVAQGVFLSGQLNRWQRLLAFVSGHGEGWALYAERLMDELGYLADPGNKLGMLDAQMLRAARVVVDLGVHAELPIPADSPWHPGETWNADLVWEFLRSRVQTDDASLRFEVDRYLGWIGQASSYKLGERIWLGAREDAKQRKGATFDLKQFHGQALALGSIGLDLLRNILAQF
jgi:uncharacterized protein (DUF885 family)